MLIPVYRITRKVRNNIRSFLTLFPSKVLFFFFSSLLKVYAILPYFIRDCTAAVPDKDFRSYFIAVCSVPILIPGDSVFSVPHRSFGNEVTDLNRYAVIEQIRRHILL